MQKNQPRTMVKKRRDGGIMVWSPRGARAGRRECNTAFYWLIRRLIFLGSWGFGDLPLTGLSIPVFIPLTARVRCSGFAINYRAKHNILHVEHVATLLASLKRRDVAIRKII